MSSSQSLAWTCFWCGMPALALEVLRGFHPNHMASASLGALLLTGSVCGAWIYWRQLSRIQQLHIQSNRPTDSSTLDDRGVGPWMIKT
jgi:hypothetical protein